MKKLYAFLTIKQLLKAGEDGLGEETEEEAREETPRQRALRLALENNFVTEVNTSRVEIEVGNFYPAKCPFDLTVPR